MKRISSSFTSRRRFLKQAGAVALATLPASSRTVHALSKSAASVTAASPDSAIRNRAPLAQNAFYQLPLGAVRPAGWLRSQLQIQASGLSGHLDETWTDVGSNSAWLGGTGEAWERGPYFIDGLIPLAYLLDDARLKAKAQKFIDWTLNNQAANGMIAPPAMMTGGRAW